MYIPQSLLIFSIENLLAFWALERMQKRAQTSILSVDRWQNCSKELKFVFLLLFKAVRLVAFMQTDFLEKESRRFKSNFNVDNEVGAWPQSQLHRVNQWVDWTHLVNTLKHSAMKGMSLPSSPWSLTISKMFKFALYLQWLSCISIRELVRTWTWTLVQVPSHHHGHSSWCNVSKHLQTRTTWVGTCTMDTWFMNVTHLYNFIAILSEAGKIEKNIGFCQISTKQLDSDSDSVTPVKTIIWPGPFLFGLPHCHLCQL